MNRIVRVTRLHLNKPQAMFSVPVQIVCAVLVMTAVISLVLQRGGLDPASPDFVDGARMNSGMIWALPGFLIYYGVQAVATTYPFALALGASRRAYVIGTAIANVILAAFITVLMLTLLGIELATNHWFANIYALDVFLLGSGDPLVLAPTVFLLAFGAMSVGGYFGAIWVRFGNRGPTISALVLGLALAILLLVFVPYSQEIIASVTGPVLAAVGLGISLLALLGTWLAMRRASVR